MPTIHNVNNDTIQERLRQKRESEEQHRVWLDALLNEHDVARITGMSVATVRRWRLLGKGPTYLKIGSAVRYRKEDLASWIASRPTGGASHEQA